MRNFRILITVVAAALAAVAGCSSSQQPAADRGIAVAAKEVPPKRLALVIGNAHYTSGPLSNPANDAELIARTLKGLGFTVHLYTDGSQRQMKAAIRDFGAELHASAPNVVGLFYYAGHGVQVNGRNYLIPVGAQINGDADVDIEAVSADSVLQQMKESNARLNFLILDACRNNPFVRSSRSASRGLAEMPASAGVMIAYSTSPGDVAADGSGRNSPYSEALSRAMRSSAMPAELMFKEVRDAVWRTTAERQIPWESSSLMGQNFYFASAGPDSRLANTTAAPPAVRPAQAPADPEPAVAARTTQPPSADAEAARKASAVRVATAPRPATARAPAAEPAPAERAAAANKAAQAGRKLANSLTNFGLGIYGGAKDAVKRPRSAGDCPSGKAENCN